MRNSRPVDLSESRTSYLVGVALSRIYLSSDVSPHFLSAKSGGSKEGALSRSTRKTRLAEVACALVLSFATSTYGGIKDYYRYYRTGFASAYMYIMFSLCRDARARQGRPRSISLYSLRSVSKFLPRIRGIDRLYYGSYIFTSDRLREEDTSARLKKIVPPPPPALSPRLSLSSLIIILSSSPLKRQKINKY